MANGLSRSMNCETPRDTLPGVALVLGLCLLRVVVYR